MTASVLCAATPRPAVAALPRVPVLTADVALRIAQAALAFCRADGYRVAVAILDPSGAERVALADDGVKAIDIESAHRKADAALALGARTADIASAVTANPGFARVLEQLRPGMLLVAGGVPIVVAGVTIGVIGIGGAPGGNKDQACADAGIVALQQQLQ